MTRWQHEHLLNLRPFQKRFIRRLRPPNRFLTLALTMPRGNGKSTLSAWLALQTLSPGSPLYQAGADHLLVAASLGQARRTTFAILRKMVESLPHSGTSFRITDNPNSARIYHPASRTSIQVLPASGKGAQGLGHASGIVFADEPAAWKIDDGQLMFDALVEAQGKPGADFKLLLCGTLAPAGEGHWWPDLIQAGSDKSTHITSFAATQTDVEERWDHWDLIRRVNPLMAHFAKSRRHLLDLRDKARFDSRLKARFLSYRLNCPTADKSAMLLTVADFERSLRRELPPRSGQPVVGVDLGQGRAWSSAVSVWPNGRCEAVAIAPGIPDVKAQEKRDRVPPGTYSRLVEQGSLIVAEGRRVPEVSVLMNHVREWYPRVILCDRFRHAEVLDSRPPCIIVPRISRWSSSTEDITHLRRAAADGPLAISPGSRLLLAASLSAARVLTDDGGSVRLKKSSQNLARDDVAAALILAAGEWARRYRNEKAPAPFAFAPADGQIVVM